MWHLTTDKYGVLRALGASGGERGDDVEPQSGTLSSAPSRDHYHLIWANRPKKTRSLPNAFVTANGDLREFLAWTSTYLDGYRPLTALCRVIEWDTYERSLAATPSSKFERIAAACAAVTLAEALTHGRGRVHPMSVNIPSCESTYSFCRSRALALGLVDDEDRMRRQWWRAREVAGQSERIPSAEEIDPLWQLLDNLASRDRIYMGQELFGRDLILAGEELVRSGTVDARQLQRLVGTRSDIRSILNTMLETRERRVAVFEHVMTDFDLEDGRQPAVGFFCGYLASLLNPGSFEYFELVIEHLDRCPTLLLWYALCEGLQPQTTVLDQFGGLCRRLVRDIRQPESLLVSPLCDISVDELEVLSMSRGGFAYLRNGAQSHARVELLPLVNVSLPLSWSSEPDQPSLGRELESSGFASWMRRLGATIRDLERIYEGFPKGYAEDRDSGRSGKRRGRRR